MLSQIELIARLCLAALLGGIIGFERERLSWSAGLRTHMLVCVSACLVMIVSAYGFQDVLAQDHISLDPSRMAAQVVSGIGFLGAGAILLRGEIVRGLTTAASLWSVAAVGLAAGGGLYLAAVAATAIMLFILAGLKPVERRYFASRQARELLIAAERGRITLHALEKELGPVTSRISTFIVQHNEADAGTDDVLIGFSRMSEHELHSLVDQLRSMTGVLKIDVKGQRERRTR
jgi:putative Mg2+ transporter-C (MgtC) family protein